MLPEWPVIYSGRRKGPSTSMNSSQSHRRMSRCVNMAYCCDLHRFSLVDIFSAAGVTPNFITVRNRLLQYYSLLQSTKLTNSILSTLPLPRDLDPNKPVTLPSRLLTLLIFIRDTCTSLMYLPFFLFPLIIHMPVYVMGRFGAHLVQDEEETQAQNKVAFGLISLFLIYPAAFFFLWALLWYTPFGAILAAVTVYMFAVYHNRMINGELPVSCLV